MEKLVLRVPKWQGELVFSEEILIFVGVIFLMVIGILFCFWGYKFFRTILFMGVGTVACYGSYLLVELMTPNTVIRMFLTVSFTFLGVCFAYFLDIIWAYILDKLRIRTALGKRIYLLAAPLGAAVIGLTIYYMIWRDGIVAGVITAVCLVVGLVFQHSKRKKQIRFRSYDDLMKLPRPEIEGDGLEYLSVGTVGIAGTAAKAVPETEVETAPVMEAEAIPEPAPAPKAEAKEDILEDALFVKQFNRKMEQKQEKGQPSGAVSKKQKDIRLSTGRITAVKKSNRRQDRKSCMCLFKGAVIVAFGVGCFFAGRISKGGE